MRGRQATRGHRNADSKCTSSCQCGTSKAACKNRAVEVQPVFNNPSACARHRRAVEESENEIKVNISLVLIIASKCEKLALVDKLFVAEVSLFLSYTIGVCEEAIRG